MNSLSRNLETAIEESRFLPYIGMTEKRSGPVDYNSESWSVIASRFLDVAEKLRKRGEPSTPSDMNYLESLARDRLFIPAETHLLDGERSLHTRLSKRHKATGTTNATLNDLRVALVRAGRLLSELFGTEMAIRTPTIADIHDFSVPLEHAPDQPVLEAFKEALDAAKELVEIVPSVPRVEWSPKVPVSEAIYGRLLTLVSKFVVPPLPPGHTLGDHFQDNDLPPCRNDEESKVLRLEEVAWIDDVLWYCLSFDAQIYPTQRDIAFLLSLLQEDEPRRTTQCQSTFMGRTHEPEGDTPELHLMLTKWLGHCKDTVEGDLGPFYDGLARALHYQFDKFSKKRKVKTKETVLPRLQKTSLNYLAERIPMGFVTNYDMALEDALTRTGDCHHVVCPVGYRIQNRPPEEVAWLLSHESGVDGWINSTHMNCSEILDLIRGPVIVKLHGSPLHVIPLELAPGDLYNKGRLQHRVILSEHDYFSAIWSKLEYPEWVQSQLRDRPRHLWFLNAVPGEWNHRLQIFSVMRWSDWGEDGAGARAIGPRSAVLRNTLLDRIGVSFFEGDLRALGREFSSMGILKRGQKVHA